MPTDAACCVRLLQLSASALHLDAASPFANGSFSYFRLPADPLLRLSVLKLDGSSFGSHSLLVDPFSPLTCWLIWLTCLSIPGQMCKSRGPLACGSSRKPSRASSLGLPKMQVLPEVILHSFKIDYKRVDDLYLSSLYSYSCIDERMPVKRVGVL
ncbi:hypothetical protein BHE74_00038980 [Ensete ventricosum]|nr:hypothetical protein BHE74_00038980 [Ensete ventricosum]